MQIPTIFHPVSVHTILAFMQSRPVPQQHVQCESSVALLRRCGVHRPSIQYRLTPHWLPWKPYQCHNSMCNIIHLLPCCVVAQHAEFTSTSSPCSAVALTNFVAVSSAIPLIVPSKNCVSSLGIYACILYIRIVLLPIPNATIANATTDTTAIIIISTTAAFFH